MSPHDESLLQDLLDERLDASEAAALRTRLAAEPDLAESWEELRRIRDLVRGVSPDRAPPDFLSRVRARIAAAEEAPAPFEASSAAPAGRAPAGRLPAFPHQLAVAASGLAALLLVALGVRWIVARGTSPVLATRELESAEAPAGRRTAGGLLGERADAEVDAPVAEAAPPRDLGAATSPDATSSPPAPAAPAPPPGPRGRTSAFAPGDQVPPNLRVPHDADKDDAEGLGRLEEARRRGRTKKEGDALRPAATFTWSLETEDLAAGRARLALLVGTLGDAARDASGPSLLRPLHDDDRILGSVLLCLSRDQAEALAPEAVPARLGAPAADPADAPSGSAPPAGPAEAPEAGAPGDDAQGDDAYGEAHDEAAPPARKDGKATAAVCRVRVLLVRPPDGR